MKRLVSVVWLVLLSSIAYGQSFVPQVMNLQGFLRTESGQPVNKAVSLGVRLYDSKSGGTLLVSEDFPIVPVTNGRFSVLLGSSVSIPPDLFSQYPAVYVGLTVDGSPELPRELLASVPYAFMAGRAGSAKSADKALNIDCVGCVTGPRIADGAIGGTKIADGAVDGQKLAMGAVKASHIGEQCAVGEVLKRGAGGWACGADNDTKYSGRDFALSNQACQGGSVVSGISSEGNIQCVSLPTYTAGTGLLLSGSQFSVDFGALNAVYVEEGQANSITTAMLQNGSVTAAKIGEPCEVGKILKKTQTGWACADDTGNIYTGADFALSNQQCQSGLVAVGVDQTGHLVCVQDQVNTYAAGTGLILAGNTFSVDMAMLNGLYVEEGQANSITTAMLQNGSVTAAKIGEPCEVGKILKKTQTGWACADDTGNIYTGADFALSNQQCPSGLVAVGVDQAGHLVCVQDQVNTYTQGAGIVIEGLKISIRKDCGNGQVLKWDQGQGNWVCATDLDTTYLAGPGITISGALISADETAIKTWAKEACYDNPNELVAAGFLRNTDKLTEDMMPPNGLNEISNDLITNQFVDDIGSPNTPIDIPDYYPPGVADSIQFPDIGIAEKLDVCVVITNSDISGLTVKLYDPQNAEYLLVKQDGGQSGTKIDTCFPDPSQPVSGDLKTWVGKNPKGTWRLLVIDNKFLNGQKDGKIERWSIRIRTLSNKKIEVAGDLIVDGKIQGPNGLSVNGDANVSGKLTVGGDTSVGGNLAVSKNTTVSGTLGVTGDTTLSGNLAVQKNATVTGTLGVTGDTTLSGKLTVSGDATFSGKVSFTPNIGYAAITGTQGWFNTGSWTELNTSLRVTLNKKSSSSAVRITYRDNVGTYPNAYTGWCGFEVRVDGNPISSPAPCRNYQRGGDTYYGYSDFASTGLDCIATGISAGSHTFSVYYRGYCYFGNYPWDATGRFLIVEELY